jgi:hypothetical protein
LSGFDDFLVPDAKTADEANAVLKRYMPGHNRRFSIPAAESSPAWRRVRASMDIVRTCAFHYQATVFNDNTVRLQGQISG